MSESGLLADGSPAPIGRYTVTLEAWDAHGHTGRASGLVIIPAPPAPAATFTPTHPLPPTRTSTPTRTNTSTATATAKASSTRTPTTARTPTATRTSTPTATATATLTETPTPTSTRAAVVVVISNPPQEPPETEPLSTPGVLWGAEAAAVSAMVAAYALEIRRKREEEEAQQRAEAERLNAEARAREAEYAAYLASMKAENGGQHPGTAKTQNAPVAASTQTHPSSNSPYQGMSPQEIQAEQALRAGQAAMFAKMKPDEIIAWGQAQHHAVQAASQPVAAPENISWLQRAWDTAKTFVQEKVVTPLKTAWNEHVYQPIIKPVVDWGTSAIAQVRTFITETVPQAFASVSQSIAQIVSTPTVKNILIAGASLAGLAGAAAITFPIFRDWYCSHQSVPSSSLLPVEMMGMLPVVGMAVSNKKRLRSALLGLLVVALLLVGCAGGSVSAAPTGTPTLIPCPTDTPTAPPAPPTPTETPVWMNMSPAEIETSIQYWQLQEWLAKNGLPSDWESVYQWQNQFDSTILKIATDRQIPPMLLKVLYGHEGQFIPNPDNAARPDALGSGQILPSGIDTVFNMGDPVRAQKWLEMNYTVIVGAGWVDRMVNTGGQVIYPTDFANYQSFYQNLSPDSQTIFRGFFLPFINNQCDYREANAGSCQVEGSINMAEVGVNFEFGADVLLAGDNTLSQYLERTKEQEPEFWQIFWDKLPDEEKWKVRVAAYNSGMSCIGDAIFITGNQATSWDEIASNLGSGCTAGAGEVIEVWGDLK